jgi:hypothetical protein
MRECSRRKGRAIMSAPSTSAIADRKRKRRLGPRALLHRHLDRLKRGGGAPATPDGCACHPRARAHHHNRHQGEHWVCCRDPRNGQLIWFWITLRDGLDINPHDLTPDELTRDLESWVVRKDQRMHSELPAVTADSDNGAVTT